MALEINGGGIEDIPPALRHSGEYNVLKGFLYCVTANKIIPGGAQITDENGLVLDIEAGQQAYFTATCDKITVALGAITLNIVRG